MITEKYFNTESNIILVGKTSKAGGTSLLRSLYRVAVINTTLAVVVDLENSSNRLHDVIHLGGMLEMCSMTVPPSAEVLVLIDEVGFLTTEQAVLLLELINKWSEVGNIKFICVGSESALGIMFENIVEAKYFNLSKYDSSGFLLTDTLGETVAIGSCISSGIFPPVDTFLDSPTQLEGRAYTIVDKGAFTSLLKRAIDGRTINDFCTGSYDLSSTHILKLLTMCIEVTNHSTLEGIVEKAGGRVTLDELLSTLKPFTYYTNESI